MRLKIRKSTTIDLALLYAVICLTKPAVFHELKLNGIFSLTAGLLTSAFLYFLYARKDLKMILAITAYEAILLISTVYNHNDVGNWLNLAAAFIPSCMTIKTIISREDIRGLKYMTYWMVFLVLWNFYTIVRYPISAGYSSTEWWLFEYKNWHIVKILPANILFYIYRYIAYGEEKPTKWHSMLYIISVISLYLANSSAGLFAIVLYGGALYGYRWIIKLLNRKFFSFTSYFAFVGGIFAAIVLFGVQYIFSFLIEVVLGRDLTFSTRTIIWARTFELLKDKWLLGYGVETVDQFRAHFWNVSSFTTTHNQYLWELFRGGIFLLIVFISIICFSVRNLSRYRHMRPANMLSFSILCFLLWWMMEGATSFYVFWLIMMGNSFHELIQKKDIHNARKIVIKIRSKRGVYG